MQKVDLPAPAGPCIGGQRAILIFEAQATVKKFEGSGRTITRVPNLLMTATGPRLVGVVPRSAIYVVTGLSFLGRYVLFPSRSPSKPSSGQSRAVRRT